MTFMNIMSMDSLCKMYDQFYKLNEAGNTFINNWSTVKINYIARV